MSEAGDVRKLDSGCGQPPTLLGFGTRQAGKVEKVDKAGGAPHRYVTVQVIHSWETQSVKVAVDLSTGPLAADCARRSIFGVAMLIPSLRAAQGNLILASLPKSALQAIVTDLRLRPLKVRQVLQPPDEIVNEVVFPLDGVASMISLGDTGNSVEVATIGCEGMVGLPSFLGGQKAAVEIFVQVPGEGLHLSAEAFHHHLDRVPTLMQSLLRYTQALLTQVAQCSACNVYHPVEARCARWLLQTHDRVKGDEFPLTQEFLALMLGVRRATVTETAGALQERGLIRYHRGVITVVNRKGLEAAACECYRLISKEYDRLLKPVRKRA
jgi:CRP-like cAMP-binding protein